MVFTAFGCRVPLGRPATVTQRGRVRVFRGLGVGMGYVFWEWSVHARTARTAKSAAQTGIRRGEDSLSRLIQLDWSLPSFLLLPHFRLPNSFRTLSTIVLTSFAARFAVYSLVADVALVLAAAAHAAPSPSSRDANVPHFVRTTTPSEWVVELSYIYCS